MLIGIRILHTQSQSPLLRLPRELRDRIFAEVLGERRLLHIECEFSTNVTSIDELTKYTIVQFHDLESFYKSASYGNYGFRYAWHVEFCAGKGLDALVSEPGPCDSDSESGVFHMSRYGESRFPDVQDCCAKGWSIKKSFYSQLIILEISHLIAPRSAERRPPVCRLFQTCHQIYHEARQYFWRTHVFSFSDGITFANFVLRLGATEKRLLKRIHIRKESQGPSMGKDAWPRALELYLPQLSGLQEMHLELCWPFAWAPWTSKKSQYRCGMYIARKIHDKINGNPSSMQLNVHLRNTYSIERLSLSDLKILATGLKSRIQAPRGTTNWDKFSEMEEAILSLDDP